MAWLILESGQVALNTDRIVSVRVKGHETRCDLTAYLSDGSDYVVKRFGSFAEAEKMLGWLTAELTAANAPYGEIPRRPIRLVATE